MKTAATSTAQPTSKVLTAPQVQGALSSRALISCRQCRRVQLLRVLRDKIIYQLATCAERCQCHDAVPEVVREEATEPNFPSLTAVVPQHGKGVRREPQTCYHVAHGRTRSRTAHSALRAQLA